MATHVCTQGRWTAYVLTLRAETIAEVTQCIKLIELRILAVINGCLYHLVEMD